MADGDAAVRAAADPHRIVSLARDWIGTPYRHQASLKGAGADCLGLIRGIWRETCGAEPFSTPPYARDWCEVSRDEALWRVARRWLIPGTGEREGDVLLFRMADDAPAKHLAIRATSAQGAATIIHAYSGRAVIELPFGGSWRRRVVAAFRYPEGA